MCSEMEFSDLDLTKTYTYAELFKGRVSKMSPAPSSYHQGVISNLLYDFLSLVRNKKSKHNCKIFTAPFDVRLSLFDKKQNKEITTVVQPDIVVICDKSKIDKRGCLGAPDLIVEVLSKSTAKKDVDTKFQETWRKQ
ncbi:MAG: hypothetical protein B6I20_11900 [Bacteroidetes bacterium 4572_117]|nr:MAG: hypothetical protein B6I20_11900 [Bacteroidetes bacterium 4572_117]